MIYEMVIYFLIIKSKDGILWWNWIGYYYILERMLQLQAKEACFCTRIKKMN